MNRRTFVALLASLTASLRALRAGEPATPTPTAESEGYAMKPNVPTPTWGGKQFWTDELLFHDWRIQRNVFTGGYRLLDEGDIRKAWGTFDQCRARLEQIKRERSLPPVSGKVVILLHGLARSRGSTRHMAKFLRDEGKFTTLQFGYASTRAEIAEHAKSLSYVLENLPQAEEINFVAHSLGNIVVRRYLGGHLDVPKPAAASTTAAAGSTSLPLPLGEGRGEGSLPTGPAPPAADPRIKRIVMLGPPNNGAMLAQLLADNSFFKAIAGKPGAELGPKFTELERHLATPACEFGIIAGGKGDDHGRNPLLHDDNDLLVKVSETKLPGARDFLIVPAVHTFLMDDPKAQEATVRFLLRGYFVTENERQPIGP
jgi:pimeloyl-ACP methyl ester carboxylesterase